MIMNRFVVTALTIGVSQNNGLFYTTPISIVYPVYLYYKLGLIVLIVTM